MPERITDAMPTIAGSGFTYSGGYANAFCNVPKDWLLDGDKDTDGKLEVRKDLTPNRYCQFVIEWVEKVLTLLVVVAAQQLNILNL